MEVPCGSCGAELRLNPNLQGTTVSCPRCGGQVTVPRPPARQPVRARPPTERPATGPPARRRFPKRYTVWLFGAQTALALLGASCIAGAFHRSWQMPQWSYVRENPYVLLGAGVTFFLAVWAAYHLPVLTTLAAAVAAVGACAWRYWTAGAVDASRTIALSVAMLALWLALSHRRAVTR